MNKKTVADIDLAGKRVLMRVDFNVPVKDGKVENDKRLRASLPSIQYVLGHGASLVLVDQAWMPHGDEVTPRMDVLTGPDCYVRLLGDRKKIEAITTTWGEEVLDHTDRMLRWAALIRGMMKQGVRTFVYVNNHYAGHAPTTVRRLREMVEQEA